MEFQCSDDLKAWICDVRRQAGNGGYNFCSPGQRTKLLIQINDALTFKHHDLIAEQPTRKEFRVPVLQAITMEELLDPDDGEPSQNMLSSKWHHILIEETNDHKADILIREIARIIESHPDGEPYSLFPPEW